MPNAAITQILPSHSFLLVESTIPPDITVEEWRRRHRDEATQPRLHRATRALRRARKRVQRVARME